jgi:hypothetical protein
VEEKEWGKELGARLCKEEDFGLASSSTTAAVLEM